MLRPARIGELDTLCEIDLDACSLYEQAGIRMDFAPDHEFSIAERARWLKCIEAGTTLLALDADGVPVGFAATGIEDGEPYLDQLSVRSAWMGRNIGSELLNATVKMAQDTGHRTLWLTTYRHLPWNRPFYERRGFVVVPEKQCGPALAAELAYQRRWLPAPQERVVMARSLAP